MRLLFSIVIVCAVVFVPDLAGAEISTKIPDQLVPVQCQDPNSCGTCELVKLVENIIDFTAVLLSFVVIGILIYAAVVLAVSSGNPTAKDTAKRYVFRVVVGYVLVISAWFIMGGIMKTVITGEFTVNPRDIECLYPTVAVEKASPSFNDYVIDVTKDHANEWFTGPIRGADPHLVTNNAGACSDDILSTWGAQAKNAACILKHESSCGASPVSRVDVTYNGVPFSYGIFQVNIQVNTIENCPHLGVTKLNCRNAWSGTGKSARVLNTALFEQCRNAALDKKCNNINAQRIYNLWQRSNNHGWGAWGARTACGL